MKLNYKKATGSALLLSLLVLSPSATSWGEEASSINGSAALESSQPSPQQEREKVYWSKGLRLDVPVEYDELLQTEVQDKDNMLFSVSEKASIEAAKATRQNFDGAGWLFAIGRVGEEKLHEYLCRDMSGMEVFARDESGNHYIFYHPTDVRYERKNAKAMAEDQWQWSMLNEWAWKSVRAAFLAKNPGLTEETFDNSSVAIYLARILYQPGTSYRIVAKEQGSQTSTSMDPLPYAGKLLYGVSYKMVDKKDLSKGESVVLEFPKDDVRLEFFLTEGKEDCLRMSWGKGNSSIYQAVFADGKTRSGAVMKEWYDALVADRDMAKLGYTPDALLGKWAEKLVGRGTVAIQKGSRERTYDIEVNWSNSACETYRWTMTATPSGSHALRYEKCRHSILQFDEAGTATETVKYENGVGRFCLNSANELIWQDDTGHAGDDALFISLF